MANRLRLSKLLEMAAGTLCGRVVVFEYQVTAITARIALIVLPRRLTNLQRLAGQILITCWYQIALIGK